MALQFRSDAPFSKEKTLTLQLYYVRLNLKVKNPKVYVV